MIDKILKESLFDKIAAIRQKLNDAFLDVDLMWSQIADTQIIPDPVPVPEPEPEPVGNRIWFEDFETGDFSGINKVGAVLYQNKNYAKARVTDLYAHSGRYSAELSIDTPRNMSTSAYIFIWEDFIPKEAIFRCWYYIPAAVKPGAWWNIWQWKSNPWGKDSSQGLPMYVFGIGSDGTFNLIWRPDSNSLKKFYGSSVVAPRDQWFLLEAYYRTATDATGKIVASVNGQELWNITGNPTAASDQKMFWSVNNYAENIFPDPCTIYVDDMEILAV